MYTSSQNAPVIVVKKISHNFIRNHLNHNNFFGGILQPEMALKLEVGPGVLSFNPRLSFPSVGTDDRKHACRLFSCGVIFTRARVSLALLSLRKNGGLLVV